MKHKLLFLLTCILFFPFHHTLLCSPINKKKQCLSLNFKSYLLPANEAITLYGVKRKRFITPQYYWGEVGYGAILGRRSGYLEGGLIFGYQQNIASFIFDISFFTGAAGGGSAINGSGLIINPIVSIGLPINPALYFSLELGHLAYIQDHISSTTFGCAFNMNIWQLYYNKK
jgi:hypothetical protein